MPGPPPPPPPPPPPVPGSNTTAGILGLFTTTATPVGPPTGLGTVFIWAVDANNYSYVNTGLFSSTDGGTTWTNILPGPPVGPPTTGFIVHDATQKPGDANTLYVVGEQINLSTTLRTFQFLVSTNGGSTWTVIPGPAPPPPGPGPDNTFPLSSTASPLGTFKIATNPLASAKVWFTGTRVVNPASDPSFLYTSNTYIPDGTHITNAPAPSYSDSLGVWYSTDSGSTWTKNVPNINLLSPSGLIIPGPSPAPVYGYDLYTRHIFKGSSFDANTVFISSYRMTKSIDNTSSWADTTSQLFSGGDVVFKDLAFQTDPGHIIATSRYQIYESFNNGATWTIYPCPLNNLSVPMNATNVNTLTQTWDESRYDHVNVVEEWLYNYSLQTSSFVKRLLTLKQQSIFHNGVDNLRWDSYLNRLVFMRGDGYEFDPFNLAQNDDYFAGKAIAIDVDAISGTATTPIAKFSELSGPDLASIYTTVKGIRNGNSPANGIGKTRYIMQTGQNVMEGVFGLLSHKQVDTCTPGPFPVNLGWRAFESGRPAAQLSNGLDSIHIAPVSGFDPANQTTLYPEEALNTYLYNTPVVAYSHFDVRAGKQNNLAAIVGVRQYQGSEISWLSKKVVFADFVGKLMYASPTPNLQQAVDFTLLTSPLDGTFMSAMGSNSDESNMYVATFAFVGFPFPALTSTIYQITVVP